MKRRKGRKGRRKEEEQTGGREEGKDERAKLKIRSVEELGGRIHTGTICVGQILGSKILGTWYLGTLVFRYQLVFRSVPCTTSVSELD